MVHFCGLGMIFKADSPDAREIRALIKGGGMADLRIRMVTDSGYEPVPFADVRIERKGQPRTGTVDRNGSRVFRGLYPGTYSISGSKRGFEEASSRQVTVLPGSCGTSLYQLRPASRVRGQITDFRGQPVAHMKNLDLIAWDPLFGRPLNRGPHSFDTDANGAFLIQGVLPGWYLIGSNLPRYNRLRCVLPRTFFPGTPHIRKATPLHRSMWRKQRN